jgi:hypothetical protein
MSPDLGVITQQEFEFAVMWVKLSKKGGWGLILE